MKRVYSGIIFIFLLFVWSTNLFGQQASYMNFQKLVFYHHKSSNEYVLLVYSIDDSTKPNNLDRSNIDIIFKSNSGESDITIKNRDLKIVNLGDMVYEGAQNYTLFRFNMIIDNSASIDDGSVAIIQNVLTKFIHNLPLSFEAQIIKFSTGIQLKSAFEKDKDRIISFIKEPYPRDATALFDAIDTGMQELKYSGEDIPFKFSIILTDGKDTASKTNNNPVFFKTKITDACKSAYIPLFIVGVTSDVDEGLLRDISKIGHYQHVDSFPDIDRAFKVIEQIVKDTYIFRFPAVSSTAKFKKLFIVKKTHSGKVETIQDIIIK